MAILIIYGSDYPGDFRVRPLARFPVSLLHCQTGDTRLFLRVGTLSSCRERYIILVAVSFSKCAQPFVFDKDAERMRLDPVFVAFAFHRVTEIDWYLCGGSDDFVSYDFAMGTANGYPAKRTEAMKRQKAVDGPVVPAMVPAIDIN